MTVSYQYEVASSTSGGFTRLLLMWRGSLYKLIYRELFLFLATFGVLSLLYRYAFTEAQSRLFEQVVVYCDTFISLIPLSFVLGFYVAYVAGRWWQQYMAIPWPDKSMHCIALYVNGNDIHARMVRRTLMRYLNLTLILVLRSISSAVKRRFPTLEHVVESGFMTSVELEMYQSVPSAEFNTYWIPCTWFISLLKESRKNNRITDAQGLKIIMEEFNEFRSKCGLLWSYDWVSIPLVYTQVVTIATYSFFLAAVIGRQYVETYKKPFQMEIDKFIPVFTILQFFFFMGLLKVAEQLINPFGDDDEDFELNWLIDRHTKVSYLGVDTLMMRSPPLVKDMYFNESDLTLPYTEAAVAYKKKTYRGSVHNMEVPEEKHTMFLPEIIEETEEKPIAMTPKNSCQNLQLAAVPAVAGSWRARRPSIASLVIDITNPALEKDAPVSSLWKTSLARSDSSHSKKNQVISSNVKKWPSSSTLAPSETSFKISEPEALNSNEKLTVQFKEGERKDSDAVSVEGLKFNVGLGIPGISHSNLALPTITHETKSRYLSTSKENLGPIRPVRTRNISWPKVVVNKNKVPASSGGGKKGVRWKTVLDDNSDKRKTVDVVEALSQILNADEDYIHEKQVAQELEEQAQVDALPKIAIVKVKEPVFCSNCKVKIVNAPLDTIGLDLSSGKLSTDLKKLLIYRPIEYTFKTRSCPNLLNIECEDIAISQMSDVVKKFKQKFDIKKNIVKQIIARKTKSLPAIKFENYSQLLYVMESIDHVPTEISAVIENDNSLDSLSLESTKIVPEINEKEVVECINDLSWHSADWSTLLSSRAPSLEMISTQPIISDDESGDQLESLQEVIIDLDRRETSSRRNQFS